MQQHSKHFNALGKAEKAIYEKIHKKLSFLKAHKALYAGSGRTEPRACKRGAEEGHWGDPGEERDEGGRSAKPPLPPPKGSPRDGPGRRGDPGPGREPHSKGVKVAKAPSPFEEYGDDDLDEEAKPARTEKLARDEYEEAYDADARAFRDKVREVGGEGAKRRKAIERTRKESDEEKMKAPRRSTNIGEVLAA